MEVTISVVVVASTAGICRIEPVDVDANMVVVYVLEFIITVGVELNSKEVVGRVSVAVFADESHVLHRHCVREVLVCGNKESDAMTADVGLDTVDGKDEGESK